jgi:ATP-binding cassette subfamily B multidrug efflux pump
MDEDVVGKIYDGRITRRLMGYMRPYLGRVLVSLVCLFVYSALQVCGPLLTKIAVDRYLAPNGKPSFLDPWLPVDAGAGITLLALLYLAVLGAGFVASFSQNWLTQVSGQHAMFDLRRDLMAHIQRMDLAFFDRNPVGRLVTRVTTDVTVLDELFSSGLVALLGDVLTLTFITATMFRLSPGLTALMLGVMPLVAAATVRFRHTVSQSYSRIRLAVAGINSFLQEHIVGISVLQLFGGERRAMEDFEKINRRHMEAYKDAIVTYGWFYPVVEFCAFLAVAVVLIYGGWRVQGGALSLGVVVAFLQYGLRFFRPIQDLSEKYNILQAAMAAGERVFTLMDTPVNIEASKPLAAAPGGGRIEFDHVWFAYQDEDWVLRDVTFAIEAGETIAIVGHTGAGKTTLISLLLRFYDVQRGSIRIGGADIREFDPRLLRAQFGVVLQDPYLITGTIEENIRLGADDLAIEAIVEAARQVNVLDFIENLPRQFEQPIEERGASLSTGQKQLVGFARALARQPRYLVLDEATSSVDTETEFRVRDALTRMVSGRTSIIIAHRLSTIQRADRILVMHKAQLREMGTHQELLAKRGIYWKLYQLQYQDQEAVMRGQGEIREIVAGREAYRTR